MDPDRQGGETTKLNRSLQTTDSDRVVNRNFSSSIYRRFRLLARLLR